MKRDYEESEIEKALLADLAALDGLLGDDLQSLDELLGLDDLPELDDLLGLNDLQELDDLLGFDDLLKVIECDPFLTALDALPTLNPRHQMPSSHLGRTDRRRAEAASQRPVETDAMPCSSRGRRRPPE